VLFNSTYCPGLLWFYGGLGSLDGKPQDPSLGGRPWPWFLGTKDGMLSNDFTGKWGRVLEVAFSRGTPS
jgi:hypothetical protein